MSMTGPGKDHSKAGLAIADLPGFSKTISDSDSRSSLDMSLAVME